MDTSQFDLPPAYLKGVHLRDDFDFEARGNAFEKSTAKPVAMAEPEPQESALMSDDDFLKSLLTVSDDPIGGSFNDQNDNQEPSETAPEPTQPVPSLDSVAPQKPLGFERIKRSDRFPFSIPWVREFDLEFKSAVTFLVGENGSGKSTLIEAIASLCGFPVCGGGKNDLASQFGPERKSELAEALYLHFGKRPRDGYFFRAEFYAQFASLLDQRAHDPDFKEDPYRRYGGQSPHTRSHGESFLDLLNHRLGSGLFLMDEPESALSPQRQLALMAIMFDRIKTAKTQFIIATHSPILMTFPGATILSLDFNAGVIEEVELEETSHFQLTKGILEYPEKYWRHLLKGPKGAG